MHQMEETVLIGAAVVLALAMLAALVRAILGPRFTDRIIAVNMINTMAVAEIVIFSVWLEEDFLVDAALLYALLSFLTVVVLARIVTERRRSRNAAGKGAGQHGK